MQLVAAMTILVTDDDHATRTLIREILEPLGHHILEACDGRAVRTICRSANPDVVILDLVMPEQEGIETLRILRQEFPTTHTVVISGTRFGVLLRIAEKLGAHAILQKPFSVDDLLLAITPKG